MVIKMKFEINYELIRALDKIKSLIWRCINPHYLRVVITKKDLEARVKELDRHYQCFEAQRKVLEDAGFAVATFQRIETECVDDLPGYCRKMAVESRAEIYAVKKVADAFDYHKLTWVNVYVVYSNSVEQFGYVTS